MRKRKILLARRLRSKPDWLNNNDARRGIIPPQERRVRERQP
jgi:hypothetical protein